MWRAVGRAPRARIARLGFLGIGGTTAGGFVDNCKRGLADLGYVEGQQYTAEGRYAEGDAELLPALAAELVALSPDIIVAAGSQAIAAARAASGTIPIVMSNRGDPIGGRLVISLGRPDGNITGVSGMAVELSGKRMELLREAVPGASRVGAIWRPPDASMAAETVQTEMAGQSLGVGVQPIEVHTADDFDRAYATASADHLDGVIVIAEPLMDGNRQRLVELGVTVSAPDDLLGFGICRGRRVDVLRAQRPRSAAAARVLCGQTPQGRQAGRSPDRAADEL